MSFADSMRNLEARFAAAAALDGDVYLPNFTPFAPVDAVVIGMEPSLGWWAPTPAAATSKIAAGFRNFMWSPEDFILHYAARRFLCPEGGTYHITDVSKGATTVAKAEIDRSARYARWVALLREEIDLTAKPNAPLVALGREVRSLLAQSGVGRNVASVMHYSAQASNSRNVAVEGREPDFRAFADTLSMKDILEVASDLLREKFVPDALSGETLARLRKATLSDSRKKLAFIYSTAFAKLRDAAQQGVAADGERRGAASPL